MRCAFKKKKIKKIEAKILQVDGDNSRLVEWSKQERFAR